MPICDSFCASFHFRNSSTSSTRKSYAILPASLNFGTSAWTFGNFHFKN
jgi:hypothetical protein